MFSNGGELAIAQQIRIFKTQQKILDFDKIYVVRHAHTEPIKYNLITLVIAPTKK